MRATAAAVAILLLCAGPLCGRPSSANQHAVTQMQGMLPRSEAALCRRSRRSTAETRTKFLLYLRGGQHVAASPAVRGVQDQASQASLLTHRPKRGQATMSHQEPVCGDDTRGQAPASAPSKMRRVGRPKNLEGKASAKLPTSAGSMQRDLEPPVAPANATSTFSGPQGGDTSGPGRQASARQPRRGGEKGADTGILCFKCRRSPSSSHQRSIASYCRSPVKVPEDDSGCVETDDQRTCSKLVCRQCRRPMQESEPVSNANSRAAMTRICPSIAKVRGYKRVAAEKRIEWRILESDAQRIMSRPCSFCGRLPADNPGGFNGINRVNHSLAYYDHGNIAPACSDCNTMKHDYSSRDFVQICRHVATFNDRGQFGLFPESFRNASSRRGRRSERVCE
jgi:hypothetical protein